MALYQIVVQGQTYWLASFKHWTFRRIRLGIVPKTLYAFSVNCNQYGLMSRTSNQADGDLVRDVLSIADLLEEPQLAQLYAYLARGTEATVQDAMDELGLAQGTAYTYVNRLADADIVEVTDETQPRRYTAKEIDLTVRAAAGDREYTITPALIDAVGRRETDDDIDIYIDRHGIAGLATALTYAIEREQGTVTHRLMAQDLDISPLAAEIILQALHPVVHKHYDIEEPGASIDAVDSGDADAADDA